ncbi:MAG: hypothetical protein ACK55I_49340, partial [bacterium]
MGCTASTQFPCSADESPVRSVTLTNAIYVARFEVTQAQWQARMGTNPSFFQGANYPDAATRSAITATGWAWRVRDVATQIEMVLVPPGTYQMGCTASTQFPCSADESPVRSVTLTNAIYVA